MKQFHFISIGGAVMHNLALDLQRNGNKVTGSDDEIFEPALSRLRNAGLLPEAVGWFPEKIHAGLDGIILGMHARADNPELLRAKELQLKIWSFPEFIYEHSLNKKRIVIGGSHGKTTSTAMLMHLYQSLGYPFDYMVGSLIDGFETMVKISEDAPLVILEGDEYLTSALNPVPKFHIYKPHLAMLTGIAWDHINVFPTFEIYLEQFRIFLKSLTAGSPVAWYAGDLHLQKLMEEFPNLKSIPYDTHPHLVRNGVTYLIHQSREIPIQFFGSHNLQNLSGVKILAMEAGITEDEFYRAIGSFSGTARRLEKVYESPHQAVYRDFAHSPSKVGATVKAVRELFPHRKLTACFELHTYSSLNRDFLPGYDGTLSPADEKVVFFHPHTFEIKKMQPLSDEEVRSFFGDSVRIMHTASELYDYLKPKIDSAENILLMSSGSFDGLDLKSLFHS